MKTHRILISVWTLALLAAVADLASHLWRWPHPFWVDEALHLGLPFALALYLGRWLQPQLRRDRPPSALAPVLILAALVLALGALWEIAEWLFDRLMPGDVIAGKGDTMSDLILDGVGALLGAFVYGRLAPREAVPSPVAPH